MNRSGRAVGARHVRTGAFVSEPSGRQRRPESLAEIGRTVIGHDRFDGHPLPGKPAEGALEKADRAVLALVREDLAVSQPGRVIDAHMQRFPADTVMAIDRAARSTGDAMPDPRNTPKLLGIKMGSTRRATGARSVSPPASGRARPACPDRAG